MTLAIAVPPERSLLSGEPFHSRAGTPAVIPAGGTWPGLAFEPPEGPVFDPAAPVAEHTPHALHGFQSRLRSRYQRMRCNIRSDHQNYYSWITMRDLLLGVGGGAVLANTSLDEDFQDWYQDDVRSSGTDSFGAFWKPFGDGWIFVPAFASLAVVGRMCDERPLFDLTGEFAGRVSRSYLVGAPPMVFAQYCLGAARPGEQSAGSQWRPFNDCNGVSGHAFMGAVPFITAAQMVENPWAKGCFYTLSTFTTWSRINDDGHYLSQVWLGWWMAYLACRAVADTQDEEEQFTFAPLLMPEMAGVSVVYRR